MSTFDEVLRELRGGVKVASRPPMAYIYVDRGKFCTVNEGLAWLPNQLELFAEDWVIYDSRGDAEAAFQDNDSAA